MEQKPLACRLHDAHTHMGNEKELTERLEKRIPSLLSAGSPREADALDRMIKAYKTEPVPDPPFPFRDRSGSSTPHADSLILIPTYGLHPWYAAEYSVSEMEPFLRKCPILGEIGMDSVWCNVPLSVQETVFRQQLAIACDMKKPVILHTKGQEPEIASILKEYPGVYLIHWYSSPLYPDPYLSLNCYYTIGPDVWWNKSVQAIAEGIPSDRLLLETDGMSAVNWAFSESPVPSPVSPPGSVEAALSLTLKCISQLRHIPEETLSAQLEENFRKFLSLSPDLF